MLDQISYLKIIPSYECSRGCYYCYNSLLNQKSVAVDSELAVLTATTIIDNADQPIDVEVIGGEPFQLPALHVTKELIRAISRKANCGKLILSTAVASAAVLSPYLPYISKVYLSIDASLSDLNRKQLNLRQLRILVGEADKYGCEIHISTVLHGDELAPQLVSFIESLRDAGVVSVGFTHQTATKMSSSQIKATVEIYHELFRQRLIHYGQIDINGSILYQVELAIGGGTTAAACECGRNSAVVEPDGTISSGVCLDHSVGKLRPTDVQRLNLIRQSELPKTDCQGCRLWTVCHGGCISEAKRFYGDYIRSAPVHCAVLRGVEVLVRADLERAQAI